jgi:hypothetical protein
MATDPDALATLLIRQSRLARFGTAAADGWVDAWIDSRAATVIRRARADLARVSTTARVRLGGLLLLVATVVHASVLPWTPPTSRPALPALLHVATAALGLLLVATAPAIARAWPASRLRGLILGR